MVARNIRSKPFSDINVTPFVDVMLVLLIIFMVTAPLLTVGVQVDLPETNADTLQSDNEPLEVTIDSSGLIFIQETEIGLSELIPKMKAITENRFDTKIYVRGDETIDYGQIMMVLGELSGSGFSKVALITKPLSK
ncbi:protein TolR [Pelagibacteraceae bacterium]|nr:protein TolR [Pelagibacteraceae bacterium]